MIIDNSVMALNYSYREIPVLPGQPGTSEPLPGFGIADASIDKNTVAEMWAENVDASILMPTGSVSRLVVLEAYGSNGYAHLDSFEKKIGVLDGPRYVDRDYTYRAFFWYDGYVSGAKGLPYNISLIGDGGLVPLPPSILHGCHLEWLTLVEPGMPDLPEWIFKRLIE